MNHIDRGMNVNYRTVSVIGGGAWGTAVAQSVRRTGREVKLWVYEFETAQEINNYHTNRVYLPGVQLHPGIKATAKLREAAACDVLLLVSPAQFLRSVAQELARHVCQGKPVVICSKGFEEETGKLMTDVLAEVMPQATPAVLSGPSFAAEVARNLPAALTLASTNEHIGHALTQALGHKTFRLYWTDDITGAQVGGAVKNVMAIAVGIVDGRQFGANAHAALMTRGFAELVRFGKKMGARLETLMGLSGLGDLILTCSSPQSRNMSLGQQLGQGKSLKQILGGRKSVSEGVYTVSSVMAMAKKHGIEMPICNAVHSILNGEMPVDEAIEAVLSRPLRAEADHAVAAFANCVKA